MRALAVDPAARVVQLSYCRRDCRHLPCPRTSLRRRIEPSQSRGKTAVQLSWQRGPTVDAKHTYTIQASTDGGQTWYTLGVGLTEPSIQIQKGQFEAWSRGETSGPRYRWLYPVGRLQGRNLPRSDQPHVRNETIIQLEDEWIPESLPSTSPDAYSG